MRLRHLVFALPALLSLLAAADWCPAQQLALTPYRASGIYDLGERVGWTATLPSGAAPAGTYAYVVKKNNLDVIKRGTLDLAAGRAAIEVTLKEPAMVYVEVSPGGTGTAAGSAVLVVGAAVAPARFTVRRAARPVVKNVKDELRRSSSAPAHTIIAHV